MALDRSPEIFEITLANFSFFVTLREEFTRIPLSPYNARRISSCLYSESAPIHHSHVYGQIKFSLTTFEKGHSRTVSVKWSLEATYSVG